VEISKLTSKTTLSVLILVMCAITANAQIYGGRAIGASAAINNGTTTTNYVFADTGELPARGGNITITAPSSSIPGVMSTGVLTASTSGALRSSQSVTVANDVNIVVGGVRITANRVTTNSGCICCPGADLGFCSGGTSTNALIITDQNGVQTEVFVTGAPNQQVVLPNGVGTLIINQQFESDGAITVNGLRINAAANGTTYDITVASASSALECLTTLPTPADSTVSGRVLTSKGKAISKATVTLTDDKGNVRSAVTNSSGNYSITEVDSGRTYVIHATHRSYNFSPETITVEADVVHDIIAN
jgi:hypothetical protein